MSNSLFARTARTVAEPFVIPYVQAVGLGLATITFWMIEYWFNMGGNGAFATFATMLTSLIVLIVGMQPLYVAYAGEVGVIISAVSLKDPRAGAAKAVVSYSRFVLWLVLANILVGLALGTIVFGEYFDGTKWVFPNLLLLVAAATIFGYLFSYGGKMKRKIIAGFLVLILGIIAWNWIGPENRKELADKAGATKSSSFSLGGGDCPDHVQVVEHGARVTVGIDCPVTVDQRNMRGGFDFVLVDPVLRAETGRQQLVGKEQKKDNDIVTLFANPEGYKRVDRTTIEVELYRAGTGAAEVAKRHGVFTPPIDLTPAQ